VACDHGASAADMKSSWTDEMNTSHSCDQFACYRADDVDQSSHDELGDNQEHLD